MEGESPREGFDQAEDEHLLSKEKDRQRETDLYFKIPEAKPLLSKSVIDQRKPKILIRNIKIDLEYPELLNAPIVPFISVLQRVSRREHLVGESTLWRRYVISGNFKCLYCKYRQAKLQESQRKGKKLRLELQKSTLGNEWLMATFVVDMAFLSETTSYMARNLVSSKLAVESQKIIEDKSQEIVFDSAFQSGNLMYVFAKHDLQQPREFHLILQNDVNTKGYANWFFFKLFSPKTGPIRFNLVNLQKVFSYFGQGMKPAIYSLREGKGWKMEGTYINYSRNDLVKGEVGTEKYSNLSFTIDQKHPNDTLVIAAALPYTYSRLLLFLENLEKTAKSKPNLYFRRQILGKTISGNECPLITITLKRDRKEDKTRKKIVLIIARQHPSQIVSSWVCEGVLEELTGGQQQVEELMRKYIFKVVPMVNIDGVIYGNSRCDISGSDCNRKWTKTSNQALFPIVTAIRKLASELLYEGYQIEYFIDLHGHSRKLGTFMYCCRSADEVQSRIFAWLMSKITQKFVYEQCRFGVSPFRKETARGYFGSLLSNRKAITLQTSFFGYKSNGAFKAFTPDELKQLGHSLISTIHADTFRNNGVVNWATVRNEIRQEMNNRRLRQEEESSGSDSDPEGEELTPAEKATTYLAPTVASKIGLVDIKVIEKPNKRALLSHSPELKRQSEEERLRQSIGPFDEHGINRNLMMSQSLEKKEIPSNSKNIGLRQTKSVTKIQPFRFKSLDKKPSTRTKKIRIAIDIQRMESHREPKKSAPSLPQVKLRNRQQFWTQMQQQYQTLLSEKQSIINSAKAHLQQIEHRQ